MVDDDDWKDEMSCTLPDPENVPPPTSSSNHPIEDVAPQTVAHVTKLVQSKVYDGSSFYRSDFVIQFGLYGMPTKIPHGTHLAVNETTFNGLISNTRGTAALAHFDVPDCGGAEVFINLSDNPHLDTAYGGFCVFAHIDPSDGQSLQVMDAVAAAVKQNGTVGIRQVLLTQ